MCNRYFPGLGVDRLNWPEAVVFLPSMKVLSVWSKRTVANSIGCLLCWSRIVPDRPGFCAYPASVQDMVNKKRI